MIDVISRSAELSPCGRYRYLLTRTMLFGSGTCLFVMLNPSTADHTVDDQTIRQCLGFAHEWGYQRLEVVNLFAWRATLPRDMYAAIDPIGPAGDEWILRAAIAAYPAAIPKDELADRVGVSRTSGGYFNNLGRLRTLGAIDYPQRGTVRAADILFPRPA